MCDSKPYHRVHDSGEITKRRRFVERGRAVEAQGASRAQHELLLQPQQCDQQQFRYVAFLQLDACRGSGSGHHKVAGCSVEGRAGRGARGGKVRLQK